jgi:hypothetical protein
MLCIFQGGRLSACSTAGENWDGAAGDEAICLTAEQHTRDQRQLKETLKGLSELQEHRLANINLI